MPPKMFSCTLCGKEVSKRQSLSLESLGGGKGRACRDHEIVVQLVEQKKLETEEQELLQKVGSALRIMQGTALIRVMHTIHGVPTELLYNRLRMAGWPREDIEKVREQVAEQGGPQMSREEIQDSIFMAVHLHQRNQEAQTG